MKSLNIPKGVRRVLFRTLNTDSYNPPSTGTDQAESRHLAKLHYQRSLPRCSAISSNTKQPALNLTRLHQQKRETFESAGKQLFKPIANKNLKSDKQSQPSSAEEKPIEDSLEELM
ncbi:hypothetical protein ABKV19_003941 [Rosa sericea]